MTKGPEQSDWTSYSLACYYSVIYQGIKENKGKTNKEIELTWLNQLEENMREARAVFGNGLARDLKVWCVYSPVLFFLEFRLS